MGGCGWPRESRYYKTPRAEAPSVSIEDFGDLKLAKKVDKKIEEILL
ncbi:MAG: hypothetical protein RLZZ238_826, partial [Planctomycetota bacterium]